MTLRSQVVKVIFHFDPGQFLLTIHKNNLEKCPCTRKTLKNLQKKRTIVLKLCSNYVLFNAYTQTVTSKETENFFYIYYIYIYIYDYIFIISR